MKTQIRFVLAALVLVSLLASACATPAPAVQTVVVRETVEVEKQAETVKTVDMPAMPTASPAVVEEAMSGRRYTAPAATEEPMTGSTGGDSEPNDQPYGDVFYDNYGVNPRIDTDDDNLSTFAVDVDTASYTVMRRMIGDGYLPDKDSVRVEEFINFFDQGYTPPTESAFAINIDGAPSPYAQNYHLVRVGLQGYVVPEEERPRAVLTFVVDVSGSMDMENRLGLVKQSLELLVNQLRPNDRIGLVVYGNNARVLLKHTAIENGDAILDAIRRLRPEGATNAEAGLLEGYRLARKAYDSDAINRVILCSDGVANVGNTGPNSILKQIREYADKNIYLTTIGVGMGNYNDVLMEQLANDGDGFYAYVDDIKEAERVFVNDLASSLQVIARDAKIQVEFNPDVISRYRLIGYENRDVADEDFRNDEVDAGEIGPGHSVTALYEVKFEPDADPAESAITVFVRWEDPDTREVTEISRDIAKANLSADFAASNPYFQLTAVVAQYAEILRESYWAKDAGTTLEDVSREAQRLAEYMPRDPEVQEFAELAVKAVNLSPTR
ncbi:MAG: von Willebrand factor type A domain-containing protein [Anaerolineae bacterium]|nr:von Willebrand factor type A domain-containing protein [Anaerolineae bacterium]